MDRIALPGKLLDFIKKYRFALLILALGVIFMNLPSGAEKTVQHTPQEEQSTDLSMEEQLETLLSQIQGAGKVRLMLTVSSGSETFYQTDEDITGDSVRRETVIITNSDREEAGLVRQVNAPVYQGAVVICQGGDNPGVRLAIVQAVSSLTGLGADKICVLKMK